MLNSRIKFTVYEITQEYKTNRWMRFARDYELSDFTVDIRYIRIFYEYMHLNRRKSA